MTESYRQKPKPNLPVRKLAAIASLAFLAAACSPAAKTEGSPAGSHATVAAMEIAKGFDCKLTGVIPSDDPVPEDVGLSRSRETVRISMQSSVTDAAASYREEFADGTPKAKDVVWDTPAIGGKIIVDGVGATDPDVVGIAAEEYDQNNPYEGGDISANLYPLASYPTNTEAQLFIRERVATSEGVTAEGLVFCGGMKKLPSGWALDPTAAIPVPLVSAHDS